MNNDLLKKVVELESLAKLLFDKAVSLRYSALGIEVLAGLLAVAIALLQPSKTVLFWFAVIGFVMLTVSYVLKVYFSIIYERAETMRRQAVLANALGWDIQKVQFSEWRQLAGKNLLKKLESATLDEDYYATKQESGALRLLEMTQESAFWTRHLYNSIKTYLWIIFGIATLLFLTVLTVTSSYTLNGNLSLQIAYVVYLLMPLILTIDVLGWAIKLHIVAGSIKEIECDLERLKENHQVNEVNVLRLVSEYNCQVIQGFPVPSWFFSMHHDHTAVLWKKNNE